MTPECRISISAPWFAVITLFTLLACLAGQFFKTGAEELSKPYGLNSRPQSKAYLLMPERDGGAFPPLLSQTGAFKDTRKLVPGDSLIPYDINVAFWSDGAAKFRWITVPNDASIKFAPTGEWAFPKGTVFVKHFEMAADET